MRFVPISFAAVMALCASLPQQASSQTSQPPLLRAGTKEVILDVVVHDKHGRFVKGLRAEDVRVYEDGAEQSIKTFREVEGAGAPSSDEAAPPGVVPAEALKRIATEAKFVSIVMGQMAPADVALGREAALAFVHANLPPHTLVSVLSLDLALHLVRPFTEDKKLLAAAVDQASKRMYKGVAPGAATVEAGLHDPILGGSDMDVGPMSDPSQSSFAATVQDPTFAANTSAQDASFGLNWGLAIEALLQTRLRFAQSMGTGMTTLDALRELIRSEAKLPGRKIVIFLSDGLTLPTGRPEMITNLISDANRANVTFYAVDTRGLNFSSPMSESMTELSRTLAESRARSLHTMDDLELMEASNTQLALRDLAEETGGFAAVSTNVVAKPMERVADELGSYYELTYSPKSDKYNGQFRRIEVKVDHATVETRKGYFALPDLNGEPLEPFEVAALDALNSRPLPNSFPYAFEAMRFRPLRGSLEYAVAFDVPVSSLKLSWERDSRAARLHASVFALVKDADGNVLDRVSRELYQDTPATKLSAYRSERIFYAEPVFLKPGHYTIDSAVVDQQGKTAAARRIALFVPASDLGLSSLEIVKRIDPLTGARDVSDPLEIENGRVTPTLADGVPASKPVDLFFVVYPAAGEQGTPRVTLQLIRDGKVIAQLNPNLPKPDQSGAIPMSVQISPPAGQYDVRVIARQGAFSAQSDRVVTAE